MMDLESQAMPASQEAAPADAPRDGIARGTEGSPDENRPATVAGSPAAAPPPAKRARTAATEGVKSFDGAKQFIAQLREAESAPPAEPPAEPRARHPEPETRFAETAAPRTGGAVADALIATRRDEKGAEAENVSRETRATPPETREADPPTETQETRETNEGQRETEKAPLTVFPQNNAEVNGALDAFEEDAVHVLSGLFEEDLSQALSDAGTKADPKRKRRSSVSVANASRGASRGGRSGGSIDAGPVTGSLELEGHAGTTRDKERRVTGTPSASGGGPSSSRKAADHRRLLKSYMKALFRHLRLPVDIKPADAATYRDRINSALAFWFGETFSPGRTVVECNAPKVVAVILYLATFGECKPNVEDVARVLRKGPQAKNANYAVDEGELVKLGVSVAQLKALFEGPSRVERGFPRGVPLALPDLDALPEPAPPPRRDAHVPTDAATAASRDARSALAKKKTVPEKPSSKVNERVVLPPSVGATPAAVGAGPGSLNPDPDQTEGAGESGGGAAEKKTRSRTPRHAAPRQPSNDGSPLFSPVGGVTAAFAAAALMPSANDRSSAVRAFLETHVAPALARLDQHPVEVQLEMLNCAQGAFVARAASLAKAQHRASLRAAREENAGDTKTTGPVSTKEERFEEEARPPVADAVPRGRGGKR
jgi:hypothetical protein